MYKLNTERSELFITLLDSKQWSWFGNGCRGETRIALYCVACIRSAAIMIFEAYNENLQFLNVKDMNQGVKSAALVYDDLKLKILVIIDL